MAEGTNNELRLICKIIKTQDVNSAVRSGITPNVLANPIARTMFQDILNYFHNREHYGRIPPSHWMKTRYPGSYHEMRVPETTGELCAAIREKAMEREIFEVAQEIIDINGDNPTEALEKMRAAVLHIGRMTPRSTDRTLADDADDIIARADARRSSEHILGIPFPWEELNDLTQGMQTEDFIVLFGRPKCVVEGQRVLSDTGELRVIENSPGHIAQLTTGQQIDWCGCSRSYAGEKAAVRITTQSGHVVDVGEDHPMLTPSLGFSTAGSLRVGDFVGVARKLPEPRSPKDLPAAIARLLGLLVGNGNYTRNEVQFTNEDTDVVASLRHCAQYLGADVHLTRGEIEYRIAGNGRTNPVLDLLRELGCHGQRCEKKRVPQAVFRCSNNIVAEFLSGYTDTDGGAYSNKVGWSTASPGLAHDIKHLLLRLGVTGSISQVRTNKGTDAWYVDVYSQEQHALLAESLTLSCSRKAIALRDLAERGVRRKRHDDSVPYSDLLMETILAAKGNKSWKHLWSGFSQSKLFRKTGRISRHLLRKLSEHLEAPQLLEWADSDIRWEAVKSVKSLGTKQCWDIVMSSGNPVFVVENFLTHNSMKSWVAGKLCSHAYLYGNCRVLVYSCEMSTALFEDRVSCTIHNLSYERLKQGTTSDIDWYLYQEALHALKDDELRDAVSGRHRSIKFCSAFDDPTGGGVAHLLAKAEEFDPDLIIVDSFYKMKDDRSGKRSVKWDVQYNIVQDLKGVTQLLHIPIIGVTQRHRTKKDESDDEEDLGDIAYADAVGQEADAIYRIKKDGMLADGMTVQLRVSMAGSRETRVGGFLLHVIPSTSWRLDSWLDENGKVVDGPNSPKRRTTDPSKRGGSLNATGRGGKKKEQEKGSKKANAGRLPAGSKEDLGIRRMDK